MYSQYKLGAKFLSHHLAKRGATIRLNVLTPLSCQTLSINLFAALQARKREHARDSQEDKKRTG
eukprot:761746-Hanusia_phi.AAC.6